MVPLVPHTAEWVELSDIIFSCNSTLGLPREADATLSMQDACDVACMAAKVHPIADRGLSRQQIVYGVAASVYTQDSGCARAY